MIFLQAFAKYPNAIGAVAPSSKALATAIVSAANVSTAERIVELGPGTGPVTESIIARMQPTAQFFAVERNPEFATFLRVRFPDASIICGCASELTGHISDRWDRKPCTIVSGLPWANFGQELQESLLNSVCDNLNEGGHFSTFAYFGPHLLSKGRAFRKRLETRFREVRTSQIVFANLPPAFVYSCSK